MIVPLLFLIQHTWCTRPKSLPCLVLQFRIVVMAYRRRGIKTSVNSPSSSKKPVTRPNLNHEKKRLSSLAHSLHQSTLVIVYKQRHQRKTKNVRGVSRTIIQIQPSRYGQSPLDLNHRKSWKKLKRNNPELQTQRNNSAFRSLLTNNEIGERQRCVSSRA